MKKVSIIIPTLNSHGVVKSQIIRLQNIYSQLNSESKENVWDILQALLQLCKEYKEDFNDICFWENNQIYFILDFVYSFLHKYNI